MTKAKRNRKCQICKQTIYKGEPVYKYKIDRQNKSVCSLCHNSL